MKKNKQQKNTNQEVEHLETDMGTNAPDTEAITEPATDNSGPKTAEELLAEAEEEIARLKDQYLRQVAEFDNYRKRTLKEKAELILNGGEKTIAALLPVLDDMERAQANIAQNQDYDALKEGVELIAKKLLDILEKQGLKKIDTADKDFDVDFHEAIAMVPVTDDARKGKVIDCVATGYMLNDHVLRHAKVAVGQ